MPLQVTFIVLISYYASLLWLKSPRKEDTTYFGGWHTISCHSSNKPDTFNEHLKCPGLGEISETMTSPAVKIPRS